MDLLEEALGARIFIRHARGYTLTELGEDTLRVAQKIEDLTDDLAARARDESMALEGEIKVTVNPHFLKVLMGPVARFRAENPNCQVTTIASEKRERLEHGDAHVALRVGPEPNNPDYVVTPYGRIGLNLYAHDDYIARKGMPDGPEDLAGHEFAMLLGQEGRLPFAAWAAENIAPSNFALASDHPAVITEAVLAGLGLGFMTDLDVIGRTDLHAVLPTNDSWFFPLWLLTHVDLHRTAKVQAMLACLKGGRLKK